MRNVWQLLLMKAEAQAADARTHLAELNAQASVLEANRQSLEQHMERYLTALRAAQHGTHFVADVAMYQRFIAQVQALLERVSAEALQHERLVQAGQARFRSAEQERLKASELLDRDSQRRLREASAREQRGFDAQALIRYSYGGHTDSWGKTDTDAL